MVSQDLTCALQFIPQSRKKPSQRTGLDVELAGDSFPIQLPLYRFRYGWTAWWLAAKEPGDLCFVYAHPEARLQKGVSGSVLSGRGVSVGSRLVLRS
jgi:hypothetical protein